MKGHWRGRQGKVGVTAARAQHSTGTQSHKTGLQQPPQVAARASEQELKFRSLTPPESSPDEEISQSWPWKAINEVVLAILWQMKRINPCFLIIEKSINPRAPVNVHDGWFRTPGCRLVHYVQLGDSQLKDRHLKPSPLVSWVCYQTTSCGAKAPWQGWTAPVGW